MAQRQPARKTQTAKTPVTIPDKLYFRIGDVARLCSLPAYVLRFWETEFPQLKPHKGGSGQRLYRKRDVEIVLEIKRLLYGEGFTIAGARRSLAEKRHSQSTVEEAGEQPEAGTRSSTRPKPGKPSGTATAEGKSTSGRPRFNELRDEMRALLTILGSEAGESRSVPVATKPAKQKKKARKTSTEPTLF